MTRPPPRPTLFPYTTLFRSSLPPDRVSLLVGRLEDPLPQGPFDLVVSALAVHHLDAASKADLFRRIAATLRSEEHTSELQSLRHLVCRLLLEKKKKNIQQQP